MFLRVYRSCGCQIALGDSRRLSVMGAAAASGHVQIMRYLAFTQVCWYQVVLFVCPPAHSHPVCSSQCSSIQPRVQGRDRLKDNRAPPPPPSRFRAAGVWCVVSFVVYLACDAKGDVCITTILP